MKNKITYTRLIQLFKYDAETGLFYWIEKPNRRISVGDVAGTISHGYVSVRIDGRRYPIHRLAWLYVTGEWPVSDIDHINGVRNDNRFVNLRVVTDSVNKQNKYRAQSNNEVGVLGVSMACGGKKYRARIKAGSKQKHLGVFDTAEDAAEAYLVAKRKLHPGNNL